MQKKQQHTFLWMMLIVFSSVLWKFFVGMEKIDVFLFVEKTRYPSNIVNDCASMLSWFIVFWRLSSHRCLPSRLIYPFYWLMLMQMLDYFLAGGELGAYRLLIFSFILVLYNLKHIKIL